MDVLTLTQIVYSYISASEKPESAFRRLYDIAFRGYKKIHLHSVGLPKTEKLEILSNKTAELPDGFLNELSVYTLDITGRKDLIYPDSSLSLNKASDDDRLSEDTENIDYGRSCYRIDREAGRILFDFDFSEDNVYMEYLPALQESCDDYIVNPIFEEALIAWVRWQDSKDDVKRKQEQAVNKREFYNELRTANRSIRRISPAEMRRYYSVNYYKRNCHTLCL